MSFIGGIIQSVISVKVLTIIYIKISSQNNIVEINAEKELKIASHIVFLPEPVTNVFKIIL